MKKDFLIIMFFIFSFNTISSAQVKNEKEASKVQNAEEAEVALKNLDKVLLKMGEDYWKDIERILKAFGFWELGLLDQGRLLDFGI